ncbi:mechanosensitive ion channel domain-containing protein [Sulfitobacter sp. S190]|uniref:mechanosensitive ion channel domain-containing protein n=1 Tax=Sulfitobacter sp. S190 TaxID=2867022 RepID=UPI0021A5AA84|nr:mechanosensitive ion channel domain-containing protein [Sulfitobacter sp. S190]UWR23265.1 mechanosensitive ion channel [Sulfitobacter sp. S190]
MIRLAPLIAAISLLLCAAIPVSAQDQVFEVDALNAGLPAPRGDLDLATPQSAMETFLFAIEDGAFDDAAHVLNLNDIDVASQAETGPLLAQRLATVIDRKVVISWQQLLERPDALDTTAASNNPMAGTARKSLLLGVLDLDGRGVALRLNRIKPEGGAPVWVFSRQSVANIDPLFARYGPSKFEKALPDQLRKDAFAGLKWWELLGMPLVLAIAAGISVLVWRILGKAGSGGLANSIINGLRTPVTMSVLALTVWAATQYLFVVSGALSTFLEPLLILTFVAAGVILTVNVIDAVLERVVAVDIDTLASPEEEDRRNLAASLSAARRVLVVIAVLAGTGIVLSTAKIFQTLGFSLLAAAGSMTLVLGFAAREVLGNIMASLQISLNRSARVGDQLIWHDTLCTVERVNFTYVQLRAWDDTRLIVPVSKFVSDAFINRNVVDSGMTRVAKLTVSSAVDIDALREGFNDFVAGDDRIADEGSAAMVVGQDGYGVQIRFAVPVPDPRDGWDVECELREHMIGVARAQGRKHDIDPLPHLGTQSQPVAPDTAD